MAVKIARGKTVTARDGAPRDQRPRPVDVGLTASPAYWVDVMVRLQGADTSHDGVPRVGLGIRLPDAETLAVLEREAAPWGVGFGVWDPKDETGLGTEVYATWLTFAGDGRATS